MDASNARRPPAHGAPARTRRQCGCRRLRSAPRRAFPERCPNGAVNRSRRARSLLPRARRLPSWPAANSEGAARKKTGRATNPTAANARCSPNAVGRANPGQQRRQCGRRRRPAAPRAINKGRSRCNATLASIPNRNARMLSIEGRQPRPCAAGPAGADGTSSAPTSRSPLVGDDRQIVVVAACATQFAHW